MQVGWVMRRFNIIGICMIALLLPQLSQAQSADDEPLPSRLIIKWKDHKVRSHVQSLEATSSELHRTLGVSLQRRRGISELMDGMQLQRPLNRADFAKALAKLNTYPDVEFAVEDKRRFAHAVPNPIIPNDQYFLASGGRTGQWYLNRVEASAIDAVTAWNYSTGGTAGNGVIVAVIDTGIRTDHPDLAGKLLLGRDFVECDQLPCTGSGLSYLTSNDGDGWDADPSDPGDWLTQTMIDANPVIFKNCTADPNSSWHGTRVAGIIGAATNNGIGIAGIGYNARILPIRALGRCGGYDSDITTGMRWAVGLSVPGVPVNPNPAKVINLSLGSASVCAGSAYPSVVNEIRALGVNIVASAGNDSAVTNVPANCPGVIGVVAIRNTGTKVGFSSLGPEVSIAAPGGNCGDSTGSLTPCHFSIDTTTNLGTTGPGLNDYTDQTNTNLGTSFSAPIVSGTIALMLGANPNLSPDLITARLKTTATAFPQTATNSCVTPTGTTPLVTNESECNCTAGLCGAGMVNALKAVQSVAPPTIVITGNSTVAQGATDMLDASTSTAANGSTLTYAWSVVTDTSSTATPRTGSASTFTVTAPNVNENLVIRLVATDGLSNTASKDFTITVGSGGTSSSSTSSSSASSSASSISSASSSTASSTSTTTITGATRGGGVLTWEWLISLAALLLLRTRLIQLRTRRARTYF